MSPRVEGTNIYIFGEDAYREIVVPTKATINSTVLAMLKATTFPTFTPSSSTSIFRKDKTRERNSDWLSSSCSYFGWLWAGSDEGSTIDVGDVRDVGFEIKERSVDILLELVGIKWRLPAFDFTTFQLLYYYLIESRHGRYRLSKACKTS